MEHGRGEILRILVSFARNFRRPKPDTDASIGGMVLDYICNTDISCLASSTASTGELDTFLDTFSHDCSSKVR